jgi:hypothetical protein
MVHVFTDVGSRPKIIIIIIIIIIMGHEIKGACLGGRIIGEGGEKEGILRGICYTHEESLMKLTF